MNALAEWNGQDFNGSKVALLCGDEILVYLRDDKPGIPFPGHWDLPGGGRENGETPIECALRETEEEFGIRLPESQISCMQEHAGSPTTRLSTFFFVGRILASQISDICFGDEGQYWQMMKLDAFLVHPKGISHLQKRLADYLTTMGHAPAGKQS